MKLFITIFHSILLIPILAVCVFLTGCPATETVNTPVNVSATDGEYEDRVVVTWDTVTGDPFTPNNVAADYYIVYRSNETWIGTETFFKISGDVTGTSYTDDTVIRTNKYYYRVKAFTSNGTESENSEYDEGYSGARAYNKWTQIELPNTICGNGSQYKFYANFSEESENLVIYFEPGGACWDYPSCTGQSGIRGAANPNGIVDNYADGVMGIMSPLLFRKHPLNKLSTQNWNLIFVPYCTGDVHTGNKVETYVDPTGQDPDLLWYHFGHNNTMAVIDWIKGEFSHIPKLLVSGSSAGGVGALVNYYFIKRELDVENSYLLDDSGPIYPAPDSSYKSYPLHQTIKEVWNLYSVLEAAGEEYTILNDDFGAINQLGADLYPNDRMAYTQFTMDLNFSGYSYERFYDPMNEDIVHEYWAEDQANLMAVADDNENVGYFIPHFRPFMESHCTLIVVFNGTEISNHNDMHVGDFIEELIDDDVPLQSYFEPAEDDKYMPADFLLGLIDIVVQQFM